MNIAIFTNNYLPNPYGVSTSIETFRREFERLGHTVYIFAPRWPGYIDQNPRVFRYSALDIEIKFRFPLPIPYSWKMRRILKNLDIDIIHSQHPNLLGTAAARWAKKLARRRGGKNIPLIFTWHTLYDQYAHFVKFIPKKWAANYIIKKAVRYANRADALIVPTDSIIPILRKWGVTNENITPIATGVAEEEFQNANRNIIRQKYGVNDGEILILLVSRLTSEKNIEFVMKAVGEVLKKNDKVKFLISGGGDLTTQLEEYVLKNKLQRKIILAGVVDRKELKNYYAAGDLFVYGSKSETQGMVVTEAMYMGLPIVAVNATGTNSLVLNNGNGFLVSEDKTEFAGAVQKLVDDKELRAKFSEVSARIARTQFTAEVSAKKMLEVYERAIKSYSK